MKALVWIYSSALVYALIRYVVFAPKNLENIPIFVFNKGFSMAAALCFSFAFFLKYRDRTKDRVDTTDDRAALWFRAGTMGAIAHIPLSLSILKPSYFPEFFGEERFHFLGETVVLLGSLSAVGLYSLTRQRISTHARWVLSMVFLTTLSGHVLAMGWCRGIHFNAQHAYLPPMWLLSLIGLIGGLAYCWKVRPSRKL
jgi:hypothetical protein